MECQGKLKTNMIEETINRPNEYIYIYIWPGPQRGKQF